MWFALKCWLAGRLGVLPQAVQLQALGDGPIELEARLTRAEAVKLGRDDVGRVFIFSGVIWDDDGTATVFFVPGNGVAKVWYPSKTVEKPADTPGRSTVPVLYRLDGHQVHGELTLTDGIMDTLADYAASGARSWISATVRHEGGRSVLQAVAILGDDYPESYTAGCDRVDAQPPEPAGYVPPDPTRELHGDFGHRD